MDWNQEGEEFEEGVEEEEGVEGNLCNHFDIQRHSRPM